LADRRWRDAEFRGRAAKAAVPGNAQERLHAVERALPDCEVLLHTPSRLSRIVARGKRPNIWPSEPTRPIGGNMSPATIFQLHLVLGYIPWLLCFGAYVWPRLNAMDRLEAPPDSAPRLSYQCWGLGALV